MTPFREGEAPEACADVAHAENILDHLDHDLLAHGLVPDRLPAARLIFLAVVSRLHERPVSIVIKGPSSAGKSWLLKSVLEFSPRRAYHALSSMSEKALAYGDEDLRHRMLVIYEADGLASGTGAYLIRSLLSEGRINYEVTAKMPDGQFGVQRIEREGPTGLLTSTTRIALHAENETRLLSVNVTDSPDSQRAVFARWGAEAAGEESEAVDRAGWHVLGSWLEAGERRVVIPFGPKLTDLIPPHSTRLQRDLISVLALVKASALLHRATRERDDQGRIVAALDDYRNVRELVEPIISAGVDAAVKPSIRETVEAVERLLNAERRPVDELTLIRGGEVAGVDQRTLVAELEIDKAAVSRRVGDAIKSGYLRDLETRRGYPSRIVLDQPMPVDGEVLPWPEALEVTLPSETTSTDQHLGLDGGNDRR